MSLKFIRGLAGKDHFKELTKDLGNSYTNNPQDQYFYIVPNHIKFESERQTLISLNKSKNSVYAQTQVQVFSFSRLVWYFLKGKSAGQLPILSNEAMNLMLQEIIHKNKDKLKVFKYVWDQPGFIEQVASQIKEFQKGNITPKTLSNILSRVQGSLKEKLAELKIIYTAFENKIKGNYLTKEQNLSLLYDYIKNTDISNFHFYFSGFSKLNAQELKLVKLLIKKSKETVIDLNLDKAYKKAKEVNKLSLFYQPSNVYFRLYSFAKDNHITISPDVIINENRVSTSLAEVQRYLVSNSSETNNYDSNKILNKNLNSNLELFQTSNTYDELNEVALKIRQLVASGKYHYSDFLILTPHLDKYKNNIKPIFQREDIPYFTDLQETMESNPLINFLVALFDIYHPKAKKSYQYQDVMQLLKSELLIPKVNDKFMNLHKYREVVALLDNFILEKGYERKQWLDDKYWNINDSNLTTAQIEDITKLRKFIVNTLTAFYKKIYKDSNNKAALTTLFNFLAKSGALERLNIQFSDEQKEKNNSQNTSHVKQIEDTFATLLNDIVTIKGEQSFDYTEFLTILNSGFKNSTYSPIPSTLDQVTLSESGMVQMNDTKVTFILGATEENMKRTQRESNPLNNDDRQQLAHLFTSDQYLDDTSDQLANDALYFNYVSLMTSSEKLVFSYAIYNDNDEKNELASYIAKLIQELKIDVEEINMVSSPNRINLQDFPVESYVGAPQETLSKLVVAKALSSYLRQPLSQKWEYVSELLKHNSAIKEETINNAQLGINYSNQPVPLSKENVNKLYGEELNVSITQLESYYKNPFEYFLRYGLQLKERKELQFTPILAGDFYHKALEKLVNSLKESFAVDDNHIDLNELVSKTVQDMMKNPKYSILRSSDHLKYIGNKLEETILRTLKVIKEQMQLTSLRPVETEWKFGEEQVSGLSFDLANKRSVKLNGKIDRIDKLTRNGKTYLDIIDYKSRTKEFNLNDAFAGIDLQLLSYLSVLYKNLSFFDLNLTNSLIAGGFYVPINLKEYKSKRLKLGTSLSLRDLDKLSENKLAKLDLKRYRYNGPLLDNQEVLSVLPSPRDTNKLNFSAVFPINLKKDGTPKSVSSNSLLFNPILFNKLLQHNDDLIKQAAEGIFAGNISLEPAKVDNRVFSLTNSPYKSIMQFDELFLGNDYNHIPAYSRSNIEDILLKDNLTNDDKQ